MHASVVHQKMVPRSLEVPRSASHGHQSESESSRALSHWKVGSSINTAAVIRSTFAAAEWLLLVYLHQS